MPLVDGAFLNIRDSENLAFQPIWAVQSNAVEQCSSTCKKVVISRMLQQQVLTARS